LHILNDYVKLSLENLSKIKTKKVAYYSIEQTSTQAANVDPFSTLILVFYILLGLILVVLFLFLLNEFLKRSNHNKNKIPRSLNTVLLRVLVQKGDMLSRNDGEDKAKKGPKEFAARASQMFASIYSIKDNKIGIFDYSQGNYMSFEISSHEEKISFYISVPRQLKTLVERQISGFYPDAFLEEVDRYNIFHKENQFSATELQLSDNSILPIKTYKEFEEDTINAITSTLAQLDKNEGATIQFMIRPAPNKWQKSSKYYVKNLQEGKNMKSGDFTLQNIGRGALKFSEELARAPFQNAEEKKNSDNKTKTATPIGEQQIKLINEKIAFVGFETVIRVVTSSPDKARAKMHLANIVSAFSVFNHSIGNKFVKNKRRKESQIVEDYIFRHFPYKANSILNTEELASVFHFPNKTTETPGIVWLLSKRAPAPPEVPKSGMYLGDNIFRGTRTPIYMAPADRVRHTYIIGKTGSGKSTLMKEMIVRDMKAGHGVCYIDPHGTDTEDLLARVPKERIDDVLVFDPSDWDRPIGINLLEYSRPEEKDLVVSELLNVFDKLYDLRTTGGPMFEQYFRNAALLVMDDPDSGSTIMEIPKVLADEDFRAFKLSRCKNPVIKNYWLKEAEKAGGEASLANMVPYISSKLTPFLANDIMRPIIAQQRSSFNMRELMDNQKIVFLKLSKGKIGELNAHLLGLLMISKIYLAAMSRVDMPEKDRKPFYCYIDEFQNFTTDSVASILSEARKYQLALIIGHQFISQLTMKGGDTRIRDAVFGNVGTFITYRVGPDDTEVLEKIYAGVFNAYDLTNVEFANCYVSLLANNTSLKPFSVNNYLNMDEIRKEMNPQIAEAVVQLSRLKYGRDRDIVEEEIRERA